MEQVEKIQRRLKRFQDEMEREGIELYVILPSDSHNSEFICDYFKYSQFYSGFTGENGTLIIGREETGLWTDGRFFIQAEKELAGTGVKLFRSLEENVPTVLEYIESHAAAGMVVGVNGNLMTAAYGASLRERLSAKGIILSVAAGLEDKIWNEMAEEFTEDRREPLPAHPVWSLTKEEAGESVSKKLERVRSYLKENGAEQIFISKLDDIMWLFNIRGGDIPCNPVAFSYGYVDAERAYLFLQEGAKGRQERNKMLQDEDVEAFEIKDYHDVGRFLENHFWKKVFLDKEQTSYAVFEKIPQEAVISKESPIPLWKAMKNPVELEKMRQAFLEDSVAVTKFIYWLKHRYKKEEVTEMDAAEYLDRLRGEAEGFLEVSFPTISAYGANAAMMHYTPNKEKPVSCKEGGMLLVDSGGQYMGKGAGTTDVTRTIVLGQITPQIKEDFTAVARGLLQLTRARFLYGCTGRNLDILARQPMWERNKDYKCGTGHGVGYVLNVHEGPVNISWQKRKTKEAALEEGMVVTNEPGIYIEGEYGIRLENVMVCRKGCKNRDGQFMFFETLTFVPIDLSGIDIKQMTSLEIDCLNEYHQKVYEKISPYMTLDEKIWLKEATRRVY